MEFTATKSSSLIMNLASVGRTEKLIKENSTNKTRTFCAKGLMLFVPSDSPGMRISGVEGRGINTFTLYRGQNGEREED